MYPYQAPLEDMRFILKTQTQHNYGALLLILDEAAKLHEQEMADAASEGDQLGCKLKNGEVTLSPLTKQAFSRYVEGGWMGLSLPEAYGGQGLPEVISSKVSEMFTASNNAISMIAALTISACKALLASGSQALKNEYLPKLVSGQWTGTMCMTEAHCGSDLGLIKTSAKAQSDGHYQLQGNKIFISSGEHNASTNIIHLVLARIKGAPAGTKGLSLFLVPKLLKNAEGSYTEPNKLSCIGLEHKMGIHANPTCTMAFEGAQAYLVGQENQGLAAMFTMMNEMRLGAALQGVGLSDHAFQKAYGYAKERAQGKALGGKQDDAARLIQHPDIKRMLLTQKAFAEGGRALCHYCAELIDISENEPASDETKQAEQVLSLLTPIAKAFLTETGLESAQHAIQVYGGHGYIHETGVEQLYRDGRIATLYEGTTGIQALDLLGRKVLADQGKALMLFIQEIHSLCKEVEIAQGACADLANNLTEKIKQWPIISQQVGTRALQNPEEVGAAAYDFMMYSGYICLAFFILRSAHCAQQKPEGFGASFLTDKVALAQFYFARILPRAEAHKLALLAGHDTLQIN